MIKNFLKYLLYSLLTFLLVVVVIVIFAAVTMGPSVKSNSVLVLHLQGQLTEQGPQDWKQKLLFGDVLTTRDIILSLKKAARDDRIKALIVTSLHAELGPGKAEEIRQAVKDFVRDSRKPAYGYIEDAAMMDYYICSAAPKLYLAPAGEGGLDVVGIRAEVPFLKGTLDKLGIVAEMDHVGQYKSYSETFTRQNMSDANREATSAILDSLYGTITSDVAADRKMQVQKVRQLIDQGPLTRAEAKDGGMVTGLLYSDELDGQIKKDLKVKEINRIKIDEYKQPTFTESLRGAGNKIALIYAVGSINTGESAHGYNEETLGSETISKAIVDAGDDDSIKAIVLRVDSPGGSAVASDLIWRTVVVTKKKKPVIVSMSDVAASGGYYISMGASKVFAEPGTITGSIGVVFGKFYMKGLYDKIGFTKEIIKRGEHADLYSEYVPFTEDEWKIVRKHMYSVYGDFTEKAAQGRKKTQQQIDAIGQGRVWSGEQAIKLGLVDRLGGMSDAIDEAKKEARIPQKEEASLVIYPAAHGGFSDILYSPQPKFELPEDVNLLLNWAKIAEHENVLLLMPYRFRMD